MNSMVDVSGNGQAVMTTGTIGRNGGPNGTNNNNNGRQQFGAAPNFEHKKLCRVSHGPRVVLGPAVSCSTPSPTGKSEYASTQRVKSSIPSSVKFITAQNDFVPISTAVPTTFSDSAPTAAATCCPQLLHASPLAASADFSNSQQQHPRRRLETLDSSGSFYCSSSSEDRDFRQCSIGDDNLSIVESEDSFSCCSNSQKNLAALVSPSCCCSDHVTPRGSKNEDAITTELSKLRLQDSGYCSSLPLDGLYDYNSAEYAALLDFALKLGYNEIQLRTVLQRYPVGAYIGQDKVLSELIKLGQDVQQDNCVAVNSSSICGSNSPKSASGFGLLMEMTSGQQQMLTSGHSTNDVTLRSVVIDGSNVAMTHGHKEIFSCKGIKDCVDWFKARGHTDIKVFVPQFRKEASRSDSPITDQHILFELEQEGILIWTPSRRLGGRRIVCHDDKYIVRTASDKDAVIVSNDEYRDIMKENPEFKKVIEERLLMYSFVDGKFMPPDDPLGRYGPKLDQFLRKGFTHTVATLCPYGRKCTYGNKCKFSHPERPGGLHRSVTDRLKDHADLHRRISPSNSLQPSNMTNKSAEYVPINNLATATAAGHHHPMACRSQSLTQGALMRHQSPSPLCQSPPKSSQHQQLQQQQFAFLQQQQNSSQQQPNTIRKNNSQLINNVIAREHVTKQLSNPENNSEKVKSALIGGFPQQPPAPYLFAPPTSHQPPTNQNAKRKPLRAAASFTVGHAGENFLIPPALQNIWRMTCHQPIGRNLSAPGQPAQSQPNAPANENGPNSFPPADCYWPIPTDQNNPTTTTTYPVSSYPPPPVITTTSTAYSNAAIMMMMNAAGLAEQQHRKNSISDSQLNLLGHQHNQTFTQQQLQPLLGNAYNRTTAVDAESGDVFNAAAPLAARNGSDSPPSAISAPGGGAATNWFVPSTTVWGPLENSAMPFFSCSSSWHHHSPSSQLGASSQFGAGAAHLSPRSIDGMTHHSYVTTSKMTLSPPSSDNEKRQQLFYHLSKLFSADVVAMVMNANQNESDPQRLCHLILLENAKRTPTTTAPPIGGNGMMTSLDNN